MAFSFNFDIKVKTVGLCQGDAKTEKDQECCLKTQVKDDVTSTPKPVKPAREHTVPSDVDSLLRDVVTETVRVGALPPLMCVNESVLELTAEERQGDEEEEEEVLKKMAAQRSDLLPGVYEGGLRVWECTYDLLAHLDARPECDEQGGGVFSGRRVLDLGCGAGLLGIMAMRLGAELVDFQDYNSTVIRQLTIANAALNQREEEEEEEEGEKEDEEEDEVKQEKEEEEKEVEEEEEEGKKKKRKKKGDAQPRVGEKRGKGDGRERQMDEKNRSEKRGEEKESPLPKRRRAPPAFAPLHCRCRFFSGDWTSFLSLIQQRSPAHKYDIILTSETIYNTDYYAALHELLHRLLADDGQVLLATKAHYFGVGGGLLLFERFVEERGVFETRRLLDVDEGLQRHVLALTFKRHNTHTSPSTHTSHATASNGARQKMK